MKRPARAIGIAAIYVAVALVGGSILNYWATDSRIPHSVRSLPPGFSSSTDDVSIISTTYLTTVEGATAVRVLVDGKPSRKVRIQVGFSAKLDPCKSRERQGANTLFTCALSTPQSLIGATTPVLRGHISKARW